MKTKAYILPNNSGEATSEKQQADLCIICQVSSLATCIVQYIMIYQIPYFLGLYFIRVWCLETLIFLLLIGILMHDFTGWI